MDKPPSKMILKGLQNNDLLLHVEKIKENDLFCLQHLLSLCPFESIKLFNNQETKKKKTLFCHTRAFQILLTMISQNILKHQTTHNFTLLNFELNIASCQSLTESIQISNSLRELVITSCHLTT